VTCFTLKGVTRDYGGRRVLDIPVLEIEDGMVHALLGPNGAGKTTLLNILALLEQPSAGELRYRGGSPCQTERDRQRLRREIVLVDQHPVMFSTTVLRNMEFGLRARNVGREERERRIAEALELVGMENCSSQPAHRLSGGETQRVAMARAIALAPRVLLCDEPTSNVDVENQAIIFDILRQINGEKGVTVVFTTHDRTQAEHQAHRLLTLDQGRLVSGDHENIFSAEMRTGTGSSTWCHLYAGIALESRITEDIRHGGRARISIDSSRIVLNGAMKGEGGNVVSGRVRQVTEVNGNVRVVVDGGLWFTVVLPSGDYRKSPVPVGETVSLHVPPEAIRLLP
jgi:tungstate transport system ATP-binding protein